jgi:uncharacterized protein YuzE
MKITYDKSADAMYIYLNPKRKIAKTMPLSESLLLDVDKKGNAVGLEILFVSSGKDVKNLNKNLKSGVPIELLSGWSVPV